MIVSVTLEADVRIADIATLPFSSCTIEGLKCLTGICVFLQNMLVLTACNLCLFRSFFCQVAGGLLPEALMLLDMGIAPNSNMASKAIGYRQATEFMKVRKFNSTYLTSIQLD